MAYPLTLPYYLVIWVTTFIDWLVVFRITCTPNMVGSPLKFFCSFIISTIISFVIWFVILGPICTPGIYCCYYIGAAVGFLGLECTWYLAIIATNRIWPDEI
jgi:hypothetical protein